MIGMPGAIDHSRYNKNDSMNVDDIAGTVPRRMVGVS